jgi:glycosyltransferase involved in cell wall biosynthesis
MYEMNSRISFFKKIGLIRKPVVLFYRGSFESNFLNYIPLKTKLAKIFFDNLFGRLIFKNSDLVISNSEPTLAIIRKKFNNKNKMVYINNALYYSEYPKWSKSNKRVLFIGRFVINKGIQYIPQILEKIPKDWIFTAVGGGPLMDYMQKLALQYPNLEIHNNMPHEKLIKLIQNSDILVLPTFAEGAPRAVMEASAVGIPSISFAVGDVPNIIPSNCGYSISPFDIDTFCEKLEYLIENPIKRTEMGKNARDFAKKVLDWRNVFPKLEKELIKLKNFKL